MKWEKEAGRGLGVEKEKDEKGWTEINDQNIHAY